MDNYNYPMGADTPDAPWNQGDIPEKEFDICVSQTLSKSTKVTTDDYTIESSYLDADEGGGYVDEIITNETDWSKAYNDDHYAPLELINEFKSFLEQRLKEIELVSYDEKSPNAKPRRCIKKYKQLIEECSNWTEDELEIVKE